MNVAELMEELEYMNPEAEVRLAIQPRYPFQHRIEGVYEVATKSPDNEPQPDEYAYEDDYCDAHDAREDAQDAPGTDVVYIAEGGQLYDAPYLPGVAADAIGWGR